ncbi:hypothetical protein [Nonomuraea sp. NPDC049400]|uniref:hypothetical protein n=1 Tax=Nonomuraea sp. NPDC049400 TaxID=3364352 RepID=UPI0037B1CB85
MPGRSKPVLAAATLTVVPEPLLRWPKGREYSAELHADCAATTASCWSFPTTACWPGWA